MVGVGDQVAGKVVAVVEVEDKTSKGIAKAEKSLASFGASAKKTGMKMTAGLTLPIVGFAAGAIKAATSFETSMTKIQSLVGLSASAVQGFEKDVLRLSGETSRAPKELADAMFFITSAGLRGADAVAALEASARAAAVGLGSTEIVADAVTNALNGYEKGTISAEKATNILIKTVEQGKASAEDLAPQFGRLVPVAAELGVEFEELGAGLAFLTRSSGNASDSTTQLYGILNTILKPSGQAKDVFDEIGLSIGEFRRQVADEGLHPALMNLRTVLEANGKEMVDVFENARAIGGALQMTGSQAEIAADVFAAVADEAGALDRGMRIVSDTAGFKFAGAMNSVRAVMITLGDQLLPIVIPLIQKLAGWITDLAAAFNGLPGPVKAIIFGLTALVALAGPVLMMLGMVASGLTALGVTAATTTAMMSAILVPLLAIIAVGAAVFAVWKIFSNRAKEAQERTDTLRTSFVNAENDAGMFKSKLEGLRGEIDALNDATEAAEGGVQGLANGFGEADSAGLLLAEVIERDVRKKFNEFITDMDHHNTLMAEGSDKYEDLADSLGIWSGQTEGNIALLEKHKKVLGEDADAIIEAVRTGDLEVAVLKDMLYALDETADANDNLAKENKKLAKEWLDNTDNIVSYVKALDEETIATIEALEANGKYVEAATLAIEATQDAITASENAAAAAEQQAAAQAGVVSMLVDSSAAFADAEDGVNHFVAALKPGRHAGDMFAESSEGIHDHMVSLRAITPEARAAIAAFNARIEAGVHPLGLYGQALRDINQEAASADRALVQMASGGQAVTEALEFDTTPIKTTYPIYEAMLKAAEEEAAAIERARVALEEKKAVLQANLNIQEEALENAEAELEALQALAEAAREPVAALKEQAAARQEGFDALRGMWQAEQNLADATQNVADIEAELERVREGGGEAIEKAEQAYRDQMKVVTGFLDAQTAAREQELGLIGQRADLEEELTGILYKQGDFQVQMHRDALKAEGDRFRAVRARQKIDEEILDLAAERIDVLYEEGKFQKELTRELNSQKLAYFDINAQVKELEGRQEELSTGAIQSQKDLIGSLQAQQAAITEAEQALIDLGIVTAADAAQADISAKQARALIKLKTELEETALAVEAGEATTLDLIVAQDDYNEAVSDARQPIDDLDRAITELAKMEKDALRIGLQLSVARDKQTVASEKLTAAEDIAGEVTKKVTEIDNKATLQAYALTDAKEAERLAVEAKTEAMRYDAIVNVEADRIGRELIKVEEGLTQAANDLDEATENYTAALADANAMEDTTAIKHAELERLSRDLEEAQWDLVASQYGLEGAQIALAEAGDKVNDAIDRMTEVSPALAAEMITMSAAARGVYPEFDTMRTTLKNLEPQIEAAEGKVNNLRTAIAQLAREMEILNGTRINQITIPNIPTPTKSVTPDTSAITAAATTAAATTVVATEVAEVVEAVTEVKEAVEAVVTAVEVSDIFAGLENLEPNAPAGTLAPAFTGGGGDINAIAQKAADDFDAFLKSLPPAAPSAPSAFTAGGGGDINAMALAALAAMGTPSAATGGFVKSAGLVNVHAGETISPRSGGVYVTINVEGSVSSERDLVESIRKGLLQAQKSGRSVVLN